MLHIYNMSRQKGWILFTTFCVRVEGNIQSSVISVSFWSTNETEYGVCTAGWISGCHLVFIVCHIARMSFLLTVNVCLPLLIEAVVFTCTQVHLYISVQLAYLHNKHQAPKDVKEFFSIYYVKFCCAFHCTMNSYSFHTPFLQEEGVGKAVLVAALPKIEELCPNS